MSTFHEVRKRRLVIHTGLPTAEIFVMDGLGVVLARGVENLEVELSCGFYKVRYLAGSEPTDEFVELPPGEGDCIHDAPRLNVALPQGRLASQPDLKPVGTPTALGRLCVSFSFESTSPPSLAGSLRIRSIDGKQVAALSQDSMNSGEGRSAVDLDAGCYLIETRSESAETIEQCVYVASGWRTEVLVPASSGVPATGNASVFMANLEQPDLSERAFDIAEMARQTLGRTNPDSTLGEAVIREMLHGKFENPMLGIYGAYLMLRGPHYDRRLLAEVAENLRRLVGDHPDVLALFLVLGDTSVDALEFPNPPMLRSAWQVIVAHSGQVPVGSYARRIGANLYGWGAWLQWRPLKGQTELGTTADREIDFVKLAQAAAKRGVSTPPPNLQPLEQILYTYLARSASQSKGALDLAKTITSNVDKKRTLGAVWSPLFRYVAPSDLETGTRGAAVRLFNPQSIAVSLGIPHSAITDAGASLSKKLGVDFGWRGYLPFKF